MKKNSLLTAIFFALAGSAFAQITTDWSGWSKGARYEGYVIYKDSKDTTKGWIEYRNLYDNQDECIFYGQQGDKKPVAKYSPENVKAYGIKGRDYRAIYYSGGLVTKKLKFLQIEKDGGIATYKWYTDGKEEAVYGKESDPNILPHQHDYFVLKFT
ncbi:MAG: hypothetical protein IAF38_18240, partial [Bacteroidia bacterium]|nr:hypothetical protein [Bacteroidia bacterium]